MLIEYCHSDCEVLDYQFNVSVTLICCVKQGNRSYYSIIHPLRNHLNRQSMPRLHCHHLKNPSLSLKPAATQQGVLCHNGSDEHASAGHFHTFQQIFLHTNKYWEFKLYKAKDIMLNNVMHYNFFLIQQKDYWCPLFNNSKNLLSNS